MPLIKTLDTDFFRCPICSGRLAGSFCINCQRQYKQILGILDLRWPSLQQAESVEAVLVEKMLEQYEHSTFQALNALRFQQSQLPEKIRSEYQQYSGNPQIRSQQMLDMFQERINKRFRCLGNEIALDLGCGIGASSHILATKFKWVIGIDADLISLILAQKYLEEQGVTNVLLACAYAQKLPIADEIVDYTIAQNVLEHLFDVEAALRELNRVLCTNGCFCGDSRNRYDLFFLEPHVKLRWVGFWPRRWQAWYVRQFRHTTYEHTKLLSLLELQKSARVIFGNSAVVTFPYSAAYNRSAKWDKVIKIIEKIPFVRWLVLLIFPSHLLVAQATSSK